MKVGHGCCPCLTQFHQVAPSQAGFQAGTSSPEGFLFKLLFDTTRHTQWLSVFLGKERLYRKAVSVPLLQTTNKLPLYSYLLTHSRQMARSRAWMSRPFPTSSLVLKTGHVKADLQLCQTGIEHHSCQKQWG